ncbi:hypothetical protein [Acetobacterium sp.]|uniref:PRC-barrel domain-containing protein n=1 Tax=Acetobacterium sp. TaxID=1872094 RepID=UPI002F3E9381
MKANYLLNVEVISKESGRRYGLVKSLVVVDHVLKYLVINPGSLFAKAQFFAPESIVDVDYKQLIIMDSSKIIKIKAKEVKKYLTEAFSLMDYPVVDINGNKFGRIVNATIDDKTYEISDYEISRSFFDDLDYGFGVAESSELIYKDRILSYQKEMFDPDFKSQGAGIAGKLLGVK